MRQRAIVPAGSQPWNRHVISAVGDLVAHCSSIGIYVYKRDACSGRYSLHKILAGHRSTITGLCWSPFTSPTGGGRLLLAATSVGKTVSVWDAATEREVCSAACPRDATPTCLDWSPTIASLILFATDKGAVVLWSAESGSEPKEAREPSGTQATVAKWSTRALGRFAVGFADGSVVVADTDLAALTVKATRRFKPPASGTTSEAAAKRPEVVQCMWDPLSTGYLLVAHRSGSIVLFDAESETALSSFEVPSGGVTCMAWVPGDVGGFVSGDSRTGVLRLWTVSKRTPLELVKVKKSGFMNVCFVKGASHAKLFCTFRDGGVGIYDLAKREFEFCREMGHTETIFDVRFRPGSGDLIATSSFDGSVKVWRSQDLSPVHNLEGHDSVVYSVSWHPFGQPQLLCATGKGMVFLWDAFKGTVVSKFQLHSDAIYKVAWDSSNPSLFATCSKDGLCIVSRLPHASPVLKYKTGKPTFGVSWSPLQPGMLAVGGQDGLIRVFDISKAAAEDGSGTIEDLVIYSLRGHTGRVFNTCWSPLLPDTLASCADDTTVRVWNVKLPSLSSGTAGSKGDQDSGTVDITSSNSVVLQGHSDNVRALAWSPELPYLLLSGSWDATVRIWDVREKGKCLKVLTDHHADIYGLDFHPASPFVFCSCSRDTTTRFWTLSDDGLGGDGDGGMEGINSEISIAKLCAVLGGALPSGLFCGTLGKALAAKLKSGACKTEAHRLKEIFCFFRGTQDITELWDLVLAQLGDSSCPVSNRLVPARDVVAKYESQAKALEMCRAHHEGGEGTVGAARKEDQLLEAAEIRLMKLGQVREYCEIMVELDRWPQALALAPGAGMAYWAELCKRYAEKLEAAGGTAKPEHFFLASGDMQRLLSYLQRQGRLDDALTISCASPSLHDVSSSVPKKAPVLPKSPSLQAGISTVAGGGPASPMVKKAADLRAKQYIEEGEGIYGACCYLVAGDAHSAVGALIRCGEHELAYAVTKVLGVRSQVDFVCKLLARRCERLGLYEMAIKLLEQTRDPAHNLSLLAIRYSRRSANASKEDVTAFYQRCGIRPQAVFDESKEDSSVSPRQRLVGCLASGVVTSAHKGISDALGYIKSELAKGQWDLTELNELVEVMSCENSTDKAQRAEILALACYIGCFNAVYLGYECLMSRLIELLKSTVKENVLSLNLDTAPLVAHRAILQLTSGKLATCVVDEEVQPEPIKSAIRSWAKAVGEPAQLQASSSRNDVRLVASTLPSRRPRSATSALTGDPIMGPTLEVERHVISLADAIMWARVMPFPPWGSIPLPV